MQEPLFGQPTAPTGQLERAAYLSECGTYRYLLTRRWRPGRGHVVWIMCNPSTADAEQDDPTIRRCVGFSRSWGFNALAVVNVSAYRSTDPRGLPDDPGPENDRWLRATTLAAVAGGGLVVAAWGSVAPASLVERAVRALPPETHCLGVTRDGAPRHPLYLPATARPERWTP
jgi:hypothetical protein